MNIIRQTATGFGHTTLRVDTGETITIAGGYNVQTHRTIVEAILDAIKPKPQAHIYKTAQDCGCAGSGGCPICDGGLALCKVCGGADGCMTADCPGRHLTVDEMDAICRGELDYKGGEWITPEAKQSPIACK